MNAPTWIANCLSLKIEFCLSKSSFRDFGFSFFMIFCFSKLFVISVFLISLTSADSTFVILLPELANACSLDSFSKISTFTLAIPVFTKPSSCAAFFDKSIILFPAKGPRSLTLTFGSTFPLSRLVTLTIEGIGSVLCAAETLF